jgi:hypothetical protein
MRRLPRDLSCEEGLEKVSSRIDSIVVIPGCATSRRPGIHTPCGGVLLLKEILGLWIPGSLAQRKIDAQGVNFVASSRPGMTARRENA